MIHLSFSTELTCFSIFFFFPPEEVSVYLAVFSLQIPYVGLVHHILLLLHIKRTAKPQLYYYVFFNFFSLYCFYARDFLFSHSPVIGFRVDCTGLWGCALANDPL